MRCENRPWLNVVRHLLPPHLGLVGISACAIVLNACAESEPTSIASPPATTNRIASVGQRSHSRGIEDVYLKIERAVPGFGGFYFDSNGNVQAYEADSTRDEAARAAVMIWLRDHTDALIRPVPANVQIRRGRFAFSQLVQWEQMLLRGATVANHVRSFDADESKNQVHIRVSDSTGAVNLKSLAASLGIPQDALAISVSDYQVQLTTLLTNQVRPVRAGLQVTYLSSPDTTEVCSAGFNVIANGAPHFLLTSHCNGAFDGTVGQVWNQADSPSRIGQTDINPAWSTTGCVPQATLCRDTDASLVKYDAGVRFSYQVAETSQIGSGNNAGNLTVGGWFDLNAPQSFDAPPGTTIEKTGTASGTTTGQVIATCVTEPPDIQFHVSVNCANEARMLDSPGDSGGPVFYWFAPLQLSVRQPEGVAFGTARDRNGNAYLLDNTWPQIQSDLGVTMDPNDPPTGTISGPTQVRPFATCSWSASAAGGVQPYTYSWSAVGATGSGQYFDYQNSAADGSSFTLQLEVTDFAGATSWTNATVQVRSTAPACQF
jgi:hypothetical protein